MDQDELSEISKDLKWEDKAHGFKDSPDKIHQKPLLVVPIKIQNEIFQEEKCKKLFWGIRAKIYCKNGYYFV